MFPSDSTTLSTILYYFSSFVLLQGSGGIDFYLAFATNCSASTHFPLSSFDPPWLLLGVSKRLFPHERVQVSFFFISIVGFR